MTLAAAGAPVEADGGALPRAASAGQADNSYPLALRAVHKRWGRGGSTVLEDLELRLEPASVTWVGGRNGAGKTTMLRIAAGLIEPDTGSARVWGLTARRDRARYQQLVSFLPAGDRGLYARLRVRHQLEFWARISLIGATALRGVVDSAIEEFHLGELAAQRVDRMSMGQRQRLRLAMTFMGRPELVLLDEPLTSLDAEGVALVHGAVERVREQGGAVLWCSPTGEQPDIALDDAWTLERGRLLRP